MSRRGAMVVLALAALVEPAAAATRTYALVIAANTSRDPGTAPLRYADDDGAKNYELFSLFADRVALFAVLDDETAGLHEATARRAELPERAAIIARLREWDALMAQDLARGDEPELYLLYAGHGDVDAQGMGYVSLGDGKLTRAELFHDLIGPSRARFVHLVIDACKSWFLVNARGAGWRDDRAADPHDGELLQRLAGETIDHYPRVGVIVATSGATETHEWSRYRSGILSHELRSALAGAGDINGDGRVEYSEARAFIAAANARVRNPEARLDVFARPPDGDRHHALVDLRRAVASDASLLSFGLAERGRFHLEDERGVRWADLNKESGVVFDVLLSPQRRYYLRRDEVEEAEVTRSVRSRRIPVAGLRFRPRALAARGALEESFRRDLYGTAYGRGFYDGFVATSGDLPVEAATTPWVVEERRRPRRLALLAGYLVSGGPLAAPGALHAADVRAQLSLGRLLDVGLAVQAGRTAPGAEEVLRVAVLASGGLEWRPAPALGLRLDLAIGWQYAAGTVRVEGAGLVRGADGAGMRAELAAGLAYDFVPGFGFVVRGGLALDLSTLQVDDLRYRDTLLRPSPLFSAALALRL